MSKDIKDTLIGVVLGIFIAMFLQGLFEFGHRDPDEWCRHFKGGEQRQCYEMYEKAMYIADQMPDNDPQCTPDHMGGCW